MERVYSDGFILDCADPFKVFGNETLQHIKNLLEMRKLQVGIFESHLWIDKIRLLRSGSETERFIYNQVMDWFSGSRLLKTMLRSSDLPSLKPVNDISSVWFETQEQEQELFDFLEKNGLLSIIKQEIQENQLSWLFKVTELPTIQYDKQFIWSDYLSPYTHFTKRICIWDRYFFYSWSQPLSELIKPFLEYNPNLEIEIVSELEENHKSYNYGLRNIARIKEAFGDRARFYKSNKQAGERYHDRYLLTSYSLLKTEPGFSMTKRNWKSFRETTPTLVGRYAADNHKWNTEFKEWDQRKNVFCDEI